MYFIKKKTFEINEPVQSLCQKNMDENYQQSDIMKWNHVLLKLDSLIFKKVEDFAHLLHSCKKPWNSVKLVHISVSEIACTSMLWDMNFWHSAKEKSKLFSNWSRSLWLFSHKKKVRNLNCAVYTRETEFAVLRSSAGRRGVAVSGYPANLYCLRFLCFCNMCSAWYYRRKWLEGHLAPPPKSQFIGQGIHTVISLHDLRDAWLENTSGPSFEMRISNDASRCNLAYTRSKILSFEWSFKMRNSNYALCSRVKTVFDSCKGRQFHSTEIFMPKKITKF